MNEEIRIFYKGEIPDSIISELENLLLTQFSKNEIVKEREDERYYNFTGAEISEIIIFIKAHSTELMAGVAINIAYDLFKNSLQFIWKKVRELSNSKQKTEAKSMDKAKSISVRIVDDRKSREIELVFSGAFDEEISSKIVDKAFGYINSGQTEAVFDNPDFIQDATEVKKIRIKYNEVSQVWEPENFGNYRREIEEFSKNAEKYFDS